MSISNGRIEWSSYLEDWHKAWLPILEDEIHNAKLDSAELYGSVDKFPNPSSVAYWGPSPGRKVFTYLNDAKEAVVDDNALEGLLSSYVDDPGDGVNAKREKTYHDHVASVLSYLETQEHGVNQGYINNVVNNHRVVQRSQFEGTELGKFETGARDIGAVGNHSWAMGRAYLWRTFQEKMAEFSAQLHLEMYDRGMQRKTEIAKVGIAQMGTWLQFEGLTADFKFRKVMAHVQWRMDLAKVSDGISTDAYTAHAKHSAMKVEHMLMVVNRRMDITRRLFEGMVSIHGAVPVRSTEYNTAANILAYGLAGAGAGGASGGASGAGWGALAGIGTGIATSLMQ